MPIRDHNPSGKLPILVIFIILINIWFFLREFLSFDVENFILDYALIPSEIDLFDFSTLKPFITSMFVHGGFMHFASNMLFLWVFGDNVEANLGKLRFVFLYFLAGVIGSLSQILFMGPVAIPMLGASGAIAGIMGAYLIMFPKARIDMIVPVALLVPLIIAVPAQFMLIYWFATQIFGGLGSLAIDTISVGGVAFWAHIGGFVTGLIFAWIFKGGKRKSLLAKIVNY